MRLIIDGNRAPAPLAVIRLKYRPDGGYDGLIWGRGGGQGGFENLLNESPVHPLLYGFPVKAAVEHNLKAGMLRVLRRR